MRILNKLSVATARAALIARAKKHHSHCAGSRSVQKIGLIAIGTLLTPVLSTPALGVTLNLNGALDFSNANDSRVSGGTALPDDGINQTTGPTGFDKFFTNSSGFGRLGATDTATTFGSESGTSRRFSNNSFSFSEASGSISVTFDYAFDGNAPSGNDTFRAYFAPFESPRNIAVSGFETSNYAPTGRTNASFELQSTAFEPNTDYVLVFALQESTVTGNSGAGFDNVSITTDVSIVTDEGTPVPFEFSPGLGILALGAWGAMAQLKSKVQKWKSFGSTFSNQ